MVDKLFVFSVISSFWYWLYINFYYLEFLFLIYEVNTVVSMHSDVFYLANWLGKCYMQTFSGKDLLWFACCVSFLFINIFLANFLTFYDFHLLLYAMFFLSTKIMQIDVKKCHNRWMRETRTQSFVQHPTMLGEKLLENCQC